MYDEFMNSADVLLNVAFILLKFDSISEEIRWNSPHCVRIPVYR